MKRYKHNLSYTHLTTGNFGDLIPVGWWEVLPGDSFRASTSVFTRCTPLLSPVMHPCQVRLHSFFVPVRLVEPDWEKFITGVDNSVNLEVGEAVGDDLDNYLGIPKKMAQGNLAVLKAPRKAYALIWKEYYRDETLQYNVEYDAVAPISYAKDWSTTARFDPSQHGTRTVEVQGDPGDQYVSTLDIRSALARQRFDEIRQRFGQRYTEYLQYLGVTPSDARLQRPEYLGGGVGPINFSEVLATAATENQPTGSLLGHGVSGVRQRPFTYFFPEHGFMFTLLSVRPKNLYTQGWDRYYRQFSPFEFWQKETELEGQQAVQNGEIYSEGGSTDTLPWGYQDRYYQYRQRRSWVSQEMNTFYAHWHMAREYAGPSAPGLNSQYTLVNKTACRRPFADQTAANDPLLFAVHHNVKARRLVGPANRNPRTM